MNLPLVLVVGIRGNVQVPPWPWGRRSGAARCGCRFRFGHQALEGSLVAAVEGHQQVCVEMIPAEHRRLVAIRVAVLGQRPGRPVIGGLAHAPPAGPCAGHPDAVVEAFAPKMLTEHQPGHRGAADVSRADKAHVHSDNLSAGSGLGKLPLLAETAGLLANKGGVNNY